ncbi:MAG TPA: VWA domain-containing protein [Pyrinomonadaceae bacterium]|nr:VWA domain-containing protein [Pyrinomonadaceae bacterium]
MNSFVLRKRFVVLLPALLILVCAQLVPAQTSCLSPDEFKEVRAKFEARQKLALDKSLRDELLTLKERDQSRLTEDIRDNRKPDDLMGRMRAAREQNADRLCSIIKKHGWPNASLVGKEGVAAAFFLLRNSSAAQLKVQLIPVIVMAATIGEISRPDVTSYIDRLRLDAGLKQLFGTQATIMDGFLVLFPIEAEKDVDLRRKQFELPPLADYLWFLQTKYFLPLIKSTGTLTNQFSNSMKNSIARTTSAVVFEGQVVDEDEVVRVETNLVNINVSVLGKKLRNQVATLTQNEFSISEDGQEQTISFFGTSNVPFDLVLLIDMSGSTSNKRDLIRKSTQRFITAARPADRLAIVTFADTATVVSPLTDDRATLLASAKKIEGNGGSNVWEALRFTLDTVIGPTSLTRRRAVVFMTDGGDNALGAGFPGYVRRGNSISFADLVEVVRHSDTLIIPIFLDSSSAYAGNNFLNRLNDNARKTLLLLANESGGLFYSAKKIENLDGVYAQVIEDLGKVYSLGYKPTNEKRDGTWRSIKLELRSQPDLTTRTRPGYYAK